MKTKRNYLTSYGFTTFLLLHFVKQCKILNSFIVLYFENLLKKKYSKKSYQIYNTISVFNIFARIVKNSAILYLIEWSFCHNYAAYFNKKSIATYQEYCVYIYRCSKNFKVTSSTSNLSWPYFHTVSTPGNNEDNWWRDIKVLWTAVYAHIPIKPFDFQLKVCLHI